MRAAVVAALAVAIAGGGACKRKRPAAVPEAAPIAALAAIPADATLVIGLDIEALAGSALVTRALDQMFVRDTELADRFTRLAQACGVDVTTQVKQVHLAMAPNPGPTRRALLVATGELAEASLTRCLQAGVGGGGGDVTVKQSGARTIYKLTEGRRVVYFGFGTADTVVIGPEEGWVEAALGDGPKVEASPVLAPRLKAVDKTAAIWFVSMMDPALGTALVRNTEGAVTAPPVAVRAELWPQDGLRAHAAFEMTSPADAGALAKFARAELMVGGMAAQAWGLGPVVGKIDVATKGVDVHFRVQLTDDELKDVLAAVDTGAVGGQDAPPPADGGLDPLDAGAAPDAGLPPDAP